MSDDQAVPLDDSPIRTIIAGLEANPRWTAVLAVLRAEGAATERERIKTAGGEYLAVIREPAPEAQAVHDIVMAALRDLLAHLLDGDADA